MKVRFFAILLTVLLVATLLPALPARAAEAWESWPELPDTGGDITLNGGSYKLTASRSLSNASLLTNGDVTLYIKSGVTLTVTASLARASGIRIVSGSTLRLMGAGTVVANGRNAFDEQGAGAGIGGFGGMGGGNNGEGMGTLYVTDSVTVTANGGDAARSTGESYGRGSGGEGCDIGGGGGSSWPVVTTGPWPDGGSASSAGGGAGSPPSGAGGTGGTVYYTSGVTINGKTGAQIAAGNVPEKCSVTWRALPNTPVIAPAGGVYDTAQQVSITCATAGAAIYYTTDGSDPSATNGTLYTLPFIVAPGTTVRAAAVLNNVAGNIATQTYTPSPKTIQPGTAVLTEGQDVYIAALPWVVLGSAPSQSATATANAIPLLCRYLLWRNPFDFDNSANYDSSDCDIRQSLDSNFYTMFSPSEQALFCDTTLTGASMSSTASNLSGQKWFLLSEDEAAALPSGLKPSTYRDATGSPGNWWTRTVRESDDTVSLIRSDGNQGYQSKHSYRYLVSDIYLRPAMYLDPTKPLYTSAADDRAHTAGLTAPADYTGTSWKMTLADGNNFHTGTSADEFFIPLGGSIGVTHPTLDSFGAGYNNVTAAVYGNGELMYYGSVNTSVNATHTSIPLPAGLGLGNYVLLLYGEQWNGANRSDVATGTPYLLEFTVIEPLPPTPAPADAPATGDGATPGLWLALLALAGVGLAAGLARRRRKA